MPGQRAVPMGESPCTIALPCVLTRSIRLTSWCSGIYVCQSCFCTFLQARQVGRMRVRLEHGCACHAWVSIANPLPAARRGASEQMCPAALDRQHNVQNTASRCRGRTTSSGRAAASASPRRINGETFLEGAPCRGYCRRLSCRRARTYRSPKAVSLSARTGLGPRPFDVRCVSRHERYWRTGVAGLTLGQVRNAQGCVSFVHLGCAVAEYGFVELMREWKIADDRARAADRALRDAYEAYLSGAGPEPSSDLHRVAHELRESARERLRAALAEMERAAHR